MTNPRPPLAPQPSFRLTKDGLEIRRGSHVEQQSLPTLVAALAKIIQRRDAERNGTT